MFAINSKWLKDKITCIMHQCQHCKDTFSNVYLLKRHQETSKRCSSTQNTQVKSFTCSECGKSYTRKDNLTRHQKVHEEFKDNRKISVDDLKTIMGDFADKLVTALADRPTNVNNNNNVLMGLPPITDEHIAENIVDLTIDIITEGAKGYADFAGNFTFKDRLLCTDKARKKLRYKNKDGQIVEDDHGVKLTQLFFQSISKKNEELINAEYSSLQEQVHAISIAGNAGTSNIVDLLDKSVHLQGLLIKCSEAAKGKENELTRGFVNHLSKML